MTGSVIGLIQDGLNSGFKADVMEGVGNPDGVVWATSGTFLVDPTNGTMYINASSAAETGSTWFLIGSIAAA